MRSFARLFASHRSSKAPYRHSRRARSDLHLALGGAKKTAGYLGKQGVVIHSRRRGAWSGVQVLAPASLSS